MKKQSDWEIEFDNKFVRDLGDKVEPIWKDPVGCVQPVKSFIAEQIKKEKEKVLVEMERFTKGVTQQEEEMVSEITVRTVRKVFLEKLKSLSAKE